MPNRSPASNLPGVSPCSANTTWWLPEADRQGVRPPRTLEDDAALGLPDPFAIRFRLDDMHHLVHVVSDQRTETKEFRFLLRSWYNKADIDPGTQHPDLRVQQLKMNVIPGSKRIMVFQSLTD